MSFDYCDRFLALVAAGLGLILAGGLNLALGRGGGWFWLRVGATLGVCGVVMVELATRTRPELAVRSVWVLSGVLLIAIILGSERTSRQLATLVAFFRKPIPRWGLVVLGGLGVVVASSVAFDRAEEAATDEGRHELEQVLELEQALCRPPKRPIDGRHAATDRGTRIVLQEPESPREANELAALEVKVLQHFQLGDQVIRHAGPTDGTNCHGWVFTGGKFLLATADVEVILKENGYRAVHDPKPGDLAVYRKNGVLAHSALVRYVTEGQPVLVEGKWGALSVFLHPADKSFYGSDYTFYRSARTGHLLVGIDGSLAPPRDPAE